MAFITKEFSKFALKEETTEGTYIAPTNADFLEVTEDGVTMEKSRDSLERNIMTGDRITKKLRLSNKNVTVSFSSELTASKVAGSAPAYSEALDAFGLKARGSAVSTVTDSGSTTTVIELVSATGIVAKDIVKIGNHKSPVVSVVGDAITILIPMDVAPAAGVDVVRSASQYKLDKTQNKTLSATRIFEGDNVEERAVGLRTQTITLENLSVGQIPTLAFALMGLNFTDILNPTSFVPAYSNAEPSYVHNACMFKNATEISVSEIGLSMEQTVSQIKTTCAPNGAIASRGTGKYNINCTFNPYKDQGDLGFTLDDQPYSLFFSIANPGSSDSESVNDIAFYIPRAKSTTVSLADVDGVHTDSVSAMAVPEDESDSIVIAFF